MIREWVRQNRLTMEWVSTSNMVADIATKNLPVAQFTSLRDWLTGYSYAKHISEVRHRKHKEMGLRRGGELEDISDSSDPGAG